MKSSPWLAVAVNDRAPAAEAPMATDIAANSDSTLMNSQGESSPFFTISPSASMMWVCGEMGYAQITSGRHRATVRATARDPSICRSIEHRQLPVVIHRLMDKLVHLGCGCHIALGQGGVLGEPVPDGRRQCP